MKDFDAERSFASSEDDRAFTIGGERFVARSATRPDIWTRYWDGPKDPTLSNQAFLDLLDETVLAILEPGQESNWLKVRTEAVPPITLGQITDVLQFALEAQSARPTLQPSDSRGGPETNGTVSKGSAPSPEEISAA